MQLIRRPKLELCLCYFIFLNLGFLVFTLGFWSTSASYTNSDEKPAGDALVVFFFFYISITGQYMALGTG